MTRPGSTELPTPSLLMAIWNKLGALEATCLGNREAMVDRTEMIRREMVEHIHALKSEVFPRFLRVEQDHDRHLEGIYDRLREVEIALGVTPESKGFMMAAIAWVLEAIPLRKLVGLSLFGLATAVMHAMPAEVAALVRPVFGLIQGWLRSAGGP